MRNISPHQYIPFLSELTGRAPQTVARWIDPDHPGMPDLSSLAVLSIQFGTDVGWLLGLARERAPLVQSQLPPALLSQVCPDSPACASWLPPLLAHAQAHARHPVAIMRGKDMAPLIADGAPFFYDDTVRQVEGNGVYLLRHQDKLLVRHIAIQVGSGLLLRCENAHYGATLIRDRSRQRSLEILGKVVLAINACPL